jgi:hypothetical protein
MKNIAITFGLLIYVYFWFPGNAEYNCHSAAWYASAGDGGIDFPNHPRRVRDISDELAAATELDAPVNGSIVVYGDNMHSAVYLGHGLCISKMGRCAIIFHTVGGLQSMYGPIKGYYLP